MNAGSGRSPDRLVWPPKPVDAQDSIRWKIPGSSRDPDRTFVDIPAELVGLDPAPQPMPSAGWLDQVERYWLGLTSQGFIERARKYGWAPDSTGTYCPRCGSRVGLYELAIPEAGDAGTSGCPACERKRLPWTRCVRLGDYHGLLRRAVHELKFRRWRPVGREIGSMLGAALAGELDRAGVARAECCIVPISSSFWRRVCAGPGEIGFAGVRRAGGACTGPQASSLAAGGVGVGAAAEREGELCVPAGHPGGDPRGDRTG